MTAATPLQGWAPVPMALQGPSSSAPAHGVATPPATLRPAGLLQGDKGYQGYQGYQGDSAEWGPALSMTEPLLMPLSPPSSPPAQGPGLSVQTLPASQHAMSAVSLPAQAPLTQVWPAPDAPGLQRVLEAAAPPVDAAPATPATGAGPATAAPGGAAPGGGGGTQDLDDLAHRLYPKIRPYLKQELWLDRERAGSLTGLS